MAEEKLKVEAAKVGLQLLHGIPLSDSQTRTIDECLSEISIMYDCADFLDIQEQLRRAVANLLSEQAPAGDPVRRAGIVMHYCDKIAARRRKNHMIRDASNCTECAELQAFLRVVADDVDDVEDVMLVREIETCADTLVELVDDFEDGDDTLEIRQELNRMLELLPVEAVSRSCAALAAFESTHMH